MFLVEDTECFAFLAGHESFAAAEGAIGIAEKANKVRQKPLRVILNGLGKEAAQIISNINRFSFVAPFFFFFFFFPVSTDSHLLRQNTIHTQTL